jgi:hypothetical protein
MKKGILSSFVVAMMLMAVCSQSYASKVVASGSEFDLAGTNDTIFQKMGKRGDHGALSFTLSDNPAQVIWDYDMPFAGSALVMAKAFDYDVQLVPVPCYGGSYTCIDNLVIFNTNENQQNHVRTLLFLPALSYATHGYAVYPYVAASINDDTLLLLTTGHTMLASMALMQNKAVTYTKASLYIYNSTTNTMYQMQNIANNISFQ